MSAPRAGAAGAAGAAVPLRLRGVSPWQAMLAAVIGPGRQAGAVLEGTLCEVTLGLATPGDDAAPAPGAGVHLATRHGPLVLRPADALRLLTGIDLPARDAADEAVRALAANAAAARLPPDWRRLLGDPRVLEGAPLPVHGDNRCALALRIAPTGATWRFDARLEGASHALRALARSAPWQAPPPRPLPEARLRLRAPVLLGRVALTLRALRSLRRGDVLLPRRARFDPEGAGTVPLGPGCLAGVLDAGGSFRFERWSADPMSDTPEDDAAARADDDDLPRADDDLPRADDDPVGAAGDPGAPPAEPAQGAAGSAAQDAAHDDARAGALIDPPIEAIPLALTIELGSLELSVAQLRALAPGQVLALERPLPPQVRLTCRGVELARGELVELDGRLGMEIAALAPAAEGDGAP